MVKKAHRSNTYFQRLYLLEPKIFLSSFQKSAITFLFEIKSTSNFQELIILKFYFFSLCQNLVHVKDF